MSHPHENDQDRMSEDGEAIALEGYIADATRDMQNEIDELRNGLRKALLLVESLAEQQAMMDDSWKSEHAKLKQLIDGRNITDVDVLRTGHSMLHSLAVSCARIWEQKIEKAPRDLVGKYPREVAKTEILHINKIIKKVEEL